VVLKWLLWSWLRSYCSVFILLLVMTVNNCSVDDTSCGGGDDLGCINWSWMGGCGILIPVVFWICMVVVM
jgi:hypothetical protein